MPDKLNRALRRWRNRKVEFVYPDCVIKVGHPKGVPAVWVNILIPEHVVCDSHKDQYDTKFVNYNVKWKKIHG